MDDFSSDTSEPSQMDEIASPNPGECSELDALCTLDVDTAFRAVVCWLQNRNTTQYFDDHPAARDAIMAAVQRVVRRIPPTPGQTPRDAPCERAPTSLRPQHVISEWPARDRRTSPSLPFPYVVHEGERDCYISTGPCDDLSLETRGRASPTVQRELENEGQPSNHTSLEDTDDLGGEQTTADSQCLAVDLGDLVQQPTAINMEARRRSVQFHLNEYLEVRRPLGKSSDASITMISNTSDSEARLQVQLQVTVDILRGELNMLAGLLSDADLLGKSDKPHIRFYKIAASYVMSTVQPGENFRLLLE
ncbi:hypothetical protein B7463_g12314, partial [Scytalidium lignicola]